MKVSPKTPPPPNPKPETPAAPRASRLAPREAQRLRKQLAEAEAKLERLEALEVDEMWLQDRDAPRNGSSNSFSC